MAKAVRAYARKRPADLTLAYLAADERASRLRSDIFLYGGGGRPHDAKDTGDAGEPLDQPSCEPASAHLAAVAFTKIG